MIAKSIVYCCRGFGSQNIVKNRHNACGNQQFWCKDCGQRGVLEPKHSYTPEQKEQILPAYTHERSSMRGIQRTFGVSRNTLTSWLKKDIKSPKLEDTLLPAQAEDVLKWTRCGFLCSNTGKNAGFGLLCAAVRARSLPMPSVIAVRRPVNSSESAS